ncbi:hypothetical protein [Herbiconiux sp. VKM Ac-2851]|uniref:hypothetical protein n=1 Tax=Herbiconiux sp. VKM Ac-2851 TaxID=2739025 RepID=UPI001566137B|nr:hypothetical protein [Herbiconiux sp. VKM Ac-2851]NQX36481.1 hypothetical protein [Herbiconiux sp. VKM Ac-2851]
MTDLRIVEHEQDDTVTYYVVTDLNPDDFPDAPSLGPFATRAEAEQAVVDWDAELIADADTDPAASGDPAAAPPAGPAGNDPLGDADGRPERV